VIEYLLISPFPKASTPSPDTSEDPVKLFPRKRHPSIETDPELRAAFDDPPPLPEAPEIPDEFDDDAFARAIAEGRARDPEAFGGQKIA
jgi:hypothetical protein